MTGKAEKSDAEALEMQNKMADLESSLNQMRRIMQSKVEEKQSAEAKLDAANKEKER